MEKAAARTEEEKKIAEERRKAKEAQAKMELHQAKAKHAAEKVESKYHHVHHQPTVGTHGHQPVGAAAPVAGATVPTYPLGGHRPGHMYK